MDRQIVYPGSLPRSADFLQFEQDAMSAVQMLVEALVGDGTFAAGLACVPTSPASMQVLINRGSIFQLGVNEASAFGSLTSDSTVQMKHGFNTQPTTFTMVAPVTPGQSVVYLIAGAFQELDLNSALLAYYNAANPSQPWLGPNNSSSAQNTTRRQLVALDLVLGAAATTGTQTPPATPTGYVPLYNITVAYGQTTITSANIVQASGAPFLLSLGSGNLGFLLAANPTYTGTLTGPNALITTLLTAAAANITGLLKAQAGLLVNGAQNLGSSIPAGLSVEHAYNSLTGGDTNDGRTTFLSNPGAKSEGGYDFRDGSGGTLGTLMMRLDKTLGALFGSLGWALQSGNGGMTAAGALTAASLAVSGTTGTLSGSQILTVANAGGALPSGGTALAGWCTLPGGQIMQWLQLLPSAFYGLGGVTATWPVAFASNVYAIALNSSVCINPTYPNGSGNELQIFIASVSTTGFSFFGGTSGGTVSGAPPLYFIAIGK
jgi:hypothetical protein